MTGLYTPAKGSITSVFSTICTVASLSSHRKVDALGWRYLSSATCLIRPRLFYMFVVASRIPEVAAL